MTPSVDDRSIPDDYPIAAKARGKGGEPIGKAPCGGGIDARERYAGGGAFPGCAGGCPGVLASAGWGKYAGDRSEAGATAEHAPG